MHASQRSWSAFRSTLALFALCGALVASSCSASGAAEPSGVPRILRVASDLDNRPFAEVDARGRPAGRDVEMMQALARELDCELEWVRMPFADLLPAVERGEVDLVCATLGHTPERAQSVRFTRPYYRTRIALVARRGAGEPQRLLDLAERRVGASPGTTSERAVRMHLPRAVWVFEAAKGEAAGSAQSSAEALRSGSLDALALDGPAAHTLVASDPQRLRVLEQDLGPEEYCLALPPDAEALQLELDRALERLEMCGALADLDARFNLTPL
jgi:ABC-type amino acid transport substrate-binding protein